MRILIADDERYTREGIAGSIDWEKYGIDCVMQAEDGEQALDIASWLQPEIVLTDIKMPRKNGIEFVEEMKKTCRAHILFMSSYMEIEYLKSAIRLSAVEYIQKPLNMAELEDALAKTVRLVYSDQQHASNAEQARALYTLMLTCHPSAIRQSPLKPHIPGDIEAWYCVLCACDAGRMGEVAEIPREEILSAVREDAYPMLGVKRSDLAVLLLGTPSGRPPDWQALTTRLAGIDRLRHIAYAPEAAPLSALWQRFEQAQAALDAAFFRPDQFAFRADGTQAVMDSLDTEKIREFEMLLKNQSPNLLEWTNGFCQHVCQGSYPVEMVKSFYFAFLQATMEMYPDLSNSIAIARGEPIEPEQLWQTISGARNIHVLQNILTNAITLCSREGEAETRSRCIRDTIQFIRANYQNAELSLTDIAEAVHLTPAYLNTSFRNETGSTIKRYLTNYRIEQAQKLLRDEHYRSKEIAACCGFCDNGYFTKVFRRWTGMTPLEYRDRFFEGDGNHGKGT
ncbi:MAG: helix-turn-helix domain-containing protein [Aristaeellaceae bacterium]